MNRSKKIRESLFYWDGFAQRRRTPAQIRKTLLAEGIEVSANLVKVVLSHARKRERERERQFAEAAEEHRTRLQNRAAKLNRSEAIRGLISQGLSNSEVQLVLAAQGIEVTANLVKVVRYQRSKARRLRPVPSYLTSSDQLVAAVAEQRVTEATAELLATASHEVQRSILNDSRGPLQKSGVEACLRELTHQEILARRQYKPPQSSDVIQIHHCRFQELWVEPETAKLVCTDIPWTACFQEETAQIAAFAKRVLKPSGLLVSYVGTNSLNATMRTLDEHLTYRWCCAAISQGRGNHIKSLNAISHTRLILVYSKGPMPRVPLWLDLLKSDQKEKEWHKWQQPLREIEQLVTTFTNQGDLVIDPCAGSFTTAIACHRTKRRCVACDCDLEAVVIGQERIDQERLADPSSAS